MDFSQETFEKIFKNHANDKKLIGIGTGKTMEAFSLILPKNRSYVASSNQSSHFLNQHQLLSLQNLSEIDVYFDSADYVDKKNNLIKGGGGALFREKLLTKIAKKTVIVVNCQKLVDSFDGLYIPVEIITDAINYVLVEISKYNLKYKIRLVNGLTPFITDNGNFIVDVEYNLQFLKNCKEITGILDHGYFKNDNFTIEMV